MNALTSKQARVLDFVMWYIPINQRPPTREEISMEFGWESNNAAQEHLKALERKGFIELGKGNYNIKVLGCRLEWVKK